MKKPKPFSARLRALRESANLTGAELAEKAGLSRQYLHMLETGKRQPSLATAVTLARALGKSVAVFE